MKRQDVIDRLTEAGYALFNSHRWVYGYNAGDGRNWPAKTALAKNIKPLFPGHENEVRQAGRWVKILVDD